MKSTITRLKEKTKTWLSPSHPLSGEEVEIREYYAAAVLLQTQLSEEITPMDNFELLRLFTFGLHLGKEEVKKTIIYSKNREKVLEKVLSILNTSSRKLLFLMDLLNLSYVGYTYGEKELEAVDIYSELLHVPKTELRILKDLIQAARQGNEAECMTIYSNMAQLKMECSLEQIRYYIPELSYTTVVDDSELIPGKTLTIHGDCEVRSQLQIPSGCKLLIQNASVRLSSSIIVDGGVIELIDSELTYQNGNYDSMIVANKKSKVKMRNIRCYCQNYCGVLNMVQGQFDCKNSAFYETNKNSAIQLVECETVIGKSKFMETYKDGAGSALYAKKCKGMIHHCNFSNCFSSKGGAIYCESPMKIETCVFAECSSQGLGDDIYYRGWCQDKVKDCHFETDKNQEETNALVQEIGDLQEIQNIKEWYVSTYFKMKKIEINVPTYMHDMKLLVASKVQLHKGGLIEKCQIEAVDLSDQDLFELSNSSPLEVRDTVIDGKEKHGIFYAVGTKLTLKDCILKNTAGGRAIYNSVDLECENTVFSNCMEGAIYGSRAFLRKCTFVNCRANHGAGAYLVGSKGLIKECRFERCVALVSGGGVSLFGNYPTRDCTFVECKPEDQK